MTHPAETAPEIDLMPAKVIYGLYALGYFIALTALAGLIYAYLTRGKEPVQPVLESHLTYQIRTFWISLAVGFAALLTMLIGIGFLIWMGLCIWGLIRVVSGFLLAHEGKPISGTKYWGMMAY